MSPAKINPFAKGTRAKQTNITIAKNERVGVAVSTIGKKGRKHRTKRKETSLYLARWPLSRDRGDRRREWRECHPPLPEASAQFNASGGARGP